MVTKSIVQFVGVFLLTVFCTIIILLANDSTTLQSYFLTHPSSTVWEGLKDILDYAIHLVLVNISAITYFVVITAVGICSVTYWIKNKNMYLINSSIVVVLSLLFIFIILFVVAPLEAPYSKIKNNISHNEHIARLIRTNVIPHKSGVILQERTSKPVDKNCLIIINNVKNDSKPSQPTIQQVELGFGNVEIVGDNIKANLEQSCVLSKEGSQVDDFINVQNCRTFTMPTYINELVNCKSLMEIVLNYAEQKKMGLTSFVNAFKNPIKLPDAKVDIMVLLQYLSIILLVVGISGIFISNNMPLLNVIVITLVLSFIFIGVPQLYERIEDLLKIKDTYLKAGILLIPSVIFYLLGLYKYHKMV